MLGLRAGDAGKAIQQALWFLGLESSTAKYCDGRGAGELCGLLLLPSHLPTSGLCRPLDTADERPEEKGVSQLRESEKVCLTRHRAGWRR